MGGGIKKEYIFANENLKPLHYGYTSFSGPGRSPEAQTCEN